MRRAFDLEVFTKVMVVLLQRFDQQVIHWKPDWPAPVGVTSKNLGARFRRLVINATGMPVHLHFVGMLLMVAGESANAVRRKKFRFIQHAAKYPLQLLAIRQRKQPA